MQSPWSIMIRANLASYGLCKSSSLQVSRSVNSTNGSDCSIRNVPDNIHESFKVLSTLLQSMLKIMN